MGGDQFEQLYADHASGLLGFLVYRTGDRGLAEDVLADTFERVLRARRRYDPSRGSTKSWLYSIALNRLSDHQRRAGAEARALERSGPAQEEAAVDAALGRIEDRDELAQALAKLSGPEREAVALRYGGDLTAPEIAKLLGEPLTTVEGRIYRALRKLREQLSEAEDGQLERS